MVLSIVEWLSYVEYAQFVCTYSGRLRSGLPSEKVKLNLTPCSFRFKAEQAIFLVEQILWQQFLNFSTDEALIDWEIDFLDSRDKNNNTISIFNK